VRPRSSALTYRRLGRPMPADAGAVLHEHTCTHGGD